MSETPPPPDGGPAMVTDDKGRVLKVRSLGLLEEMDLIELAGTPTPPDRWMMIATFAACVREVDGVPVPFPQNRAQIRKHVERVGPHGLRAAVKALAPADVPEGAEDAVSSNDPLALAKN